MTWWMWLLVALAGWCVVSVAVCVIAGRSVTLADQMESTRTDPAWPNARPRRATRASRPDPSAVGQRQSGRNPVELVR